MASFVDRFTSLPVRVQLASVAVALRHVPEVVHGSTIVVSLQQYLRMSSSSLAAEIESRRDYVITIPEELFREAQAARCRIAGQLTASVCARSKQARFFRVTLSLRRLLISSRSAKTKEAWLRDSHIWTISRRQGAARLLMLVGGGDVRFLM